MPVWKTSTRDLKIDPLYGDFEIENNDLKLVKRPVDILKDTVIYSVVLFLLGIAGTFKSINNRFIIIIIAAVAFVCATVFMFTIPLPEDFNIFGFFQR